MHELQAEFVVELAGYPTGVLCDAMGKINNLSHEIKPVFPEARLVGPACTVRCPVGDNLTIHKALETARKGDVIVVDAGNFKNAGLFGAVMAVSCLARKIAGIVIDGGCRDVSDLEKLQFPVFAAAVNPGGTVKETLGEINGPIHCGGVVINPGDIMVGDRDGVVAIPRRKAEMVAKKARAIALREEQFTAELKKGRSTMDLLGFNKGVSKKNCLKPTRLKGEKRGG